MKKASLNISIKFHKLTGPCSNCQDGWILMMTVIFMINSVFMDCHLFFGRVFRRGPLGGTFVLLSGYRLEI